MSRSIGAVSFRQEQTCETNTCFNISFVIIFYNFQIAILNFDGKVIKTILHLIQLLYHNSSNQCIIQTLVSQGFVTGELKEGFPAENIAKNDNFISLLYYFGLVTIGGFYQVTPNSRSPMRWFANRFLHISSKPMKKMTSHSRVMTSARRNN